jgi:hypothetical protein
MSQNPGDAADAALRARLEPDVTYLDRSIAVASIAVSLKRIADALAEELLERRGFTEPPGGLGR